MIYTGTVRGNTIELNEPLPFDEGLPVQVEILPGSKPRKNSPQAWLQFAGTLSDAEAEEIRRNAQECRQIDWEIWKESDK